jgi:parvulin-like peptidyl-prolyl isomerase
MRAAAELRAGAPPQQVLSHYGGSEAQRQDEEYYFAVKYRLGDALFATIKELSAGEISAPLRSTDGQHIVQMLKNTLPVPLSFEAARSQVASDYRDAAQARVMANTMKFLRSRSRIQIADDYAGDYRP